MELQQFINANQEKDGTGDVFQLENSRLLDVAVDGTVWAKAGSMVAFTGDISFKQKHGGVGKWLKKAVTGEGTLTMQATGRGHLYLADQGKRIHVLRLGNGESISVNGSDVLAFEESVEWDIKMMKKISGMASGGLFNMQLTGPGMIAFGTHGNPLVLETPVVTDPMATVAWSTHTPPEFRTDLSVGSFLGKASGEEIQMDFRQPGGFVVVQPYEEAPDLG